MSALLTSLTNLIIHIISSLGYAGIGFLMALQTIAIPIPSEVILPFAGYLASLGRFNIFVIAIVGALGSCAGASIAYYIASFGGRPLVEKYGRFILLSRHDLDITENFFKNYESPAVFFAQLLPVIRSFIAFAAGLAKAEKRKFLLNTFLGSFLWSLGLAYIGQKLGENWGTLKDRFHNLDLLIILILGLGIGAWIYRHVKNRN